MYRHAYWHTARYEQEQAARDKRAREAIVHNFRLELIAPSTAIEQLRQLGLYETEIVQVLAA